MQKQTKCLLLSLYSLQHWAMLMLGTVLKIDLKNRYHQSINHQMHLSDWSLVDIFCTKLLFLDLQLKSFQNNKI